VTARPFASIRRRLTPRHEERSNASAGPQAFAAHRRGHSSHQERDQFRHDLGLDVEHVELASDIAEDEIGPRHPRAAEPPRALFLELNPALRARSNRRQKPAIHELVFVVGPEQRHIARIAAIDAPKINAIWRAALVHRASDRRTG
jgi:hypothetical protein